MSRTLSVKTGSPVTLTNDDTGATSLKVLDFDARVPTASATLPGGSKVAVTGSDGTNYSVPASVMASSVNIEANAALPGVTVVAGNPGYQAVGFDPSLVPAYPITGTLTGAVASVLDTDGQVKGNLGSHACGPTEFAHYLCNEQSGSAIADRTGHFPGALAGTLAYSTTNLPANLASALTLDGAANYVTAGNINYADWNELTVAMWVRVASDGADTLQFLASNQSSGGSIGGWSLAYSGQNANKITMYHNGQYCTCFAAGTGFAKGAWMHVVGMIRREKFVRCVINGGALMAETALNGSSLLNEATINATNIGTRGTAGLYFFKGDVADVRIFNRALAMSEIEALYNGGAGRKLPLEVASRLTCASWSETFDYQTTNPSNTYQFTSNDSRLVAGVPIRYRQNNVLKYGYVVSNSAGTISIGGAALSTSYPIQSLAIGAPGTMHVQWITIPGSYATGKSAGAVLLNQFWGRSPAALVGVIAKHTTADTGATQPQVNAYVGGSAVSSLNSNSGPTLSTSAWTPPPTTAGTDPVAITTANYNLVFGSEIDLKLTTTGTNKNAADLRVGLLCVSK